MDASILIIGNDDFRAALLESICSLAAFTIETAANPREAVPLIQAQQPDLLLIQSQQSGSLDLCHQIKAQSRFSWIYCILVDDGWVELEERQSLRPLLDPAAHSKPQKAPSHLPPDGLSSASYPELPEDRSLRPTEAQIAALESGADAYVEVLLSRWGNAAAAQMQQRLLEAHIRAGLRQVQNHRELMRKNDLLSAIALSDPLTELNNRRALEWEMPRQIQNARLRQMPLSVVMMDVDFFKSINDTQGHLVGDRALQLLAARLRHNLRFYDTPFRYGGEEFVIILGDTGCQEAISIAQRLCHLVANQPFSISDSLDLIITISAGSACLIAEDDPKGTSLLHRADQNLLIAKAQGRNQVVGSSDP